MSVKGSTAMDLSLTTFVADVVGCSDAMCFDSQSLFARTYARPTAATASAIAMARGRQRTGDLLGAGDGTGADPSGAAAWLAPRALSRSRTDSTSAGRICSTGPPDASSHWFALRKYSKSGGNGVASMRIDRTGRFLELARSNSRSTCEDSIALFESTSTSIRHVLIACTIAAA